MDAIHRMASGRTVQPTVICLHASAASGAQWRALADRLQPEFQVLTPDLYGHGAGPTRQGAPIDIVAADAARIARLVVNAPGDVHLVGHSYGGAIALRVALYHPESVASVAVYEPVAMRVLVDYFPKQRPAAEVVEIANGIQRALDDENMERAGELFVDYWSGEGRWEELSADQRLAIASRMPVVHAHFVSLFGDVVLLHDYSRLEVPALCLTGRETRASSRRIAELLQFVLPDVESVVLDGMGHLGPITHAQAVAGRIAHFVRGQAAVRAGRERRAA